MAYDDSIELAGQMLVGCFVQLESVSRGEALGVEHVERAQRKAEQVVILAAKAERYGVGLIRSIGHRWSPWEEASENKGGGNVLRAPQSLGVPEDLSHS